MVLAIDQCLVTGLQQAEEFAHRFASFGETFFGFALRNTFGDRIVRGLLRVGMDMPKLRSRDDLSNRQTQRYVTMLQQSMPNRRVSVQGQIVLRRFGDSALGAGASSPASPFSRLSVSLRCRYPS